MSRKPGRLFLLKTAGEGLTQQIFDHSQMQEGPRLNKEILHEAHL